MTNGQITPEMARAELTRRDSDMTQKPSMGISSDQITPEMAVEELARRGEKFGEIGIQPDLLSKVIAKTQRKVGLAWQGAVGDIPFLRKVLPEEIQRIIPQSLGESLSRDIPRFSRDIAMLKGAGKLKLGGQALRGAGIGLLTADTEEPRKILESGAKGAVALPLIMGASKVATPLLQKGAKKIIKTSQQVWQDLLRAGFTVEKSSVQRAQQKGLNNIFTKTADSRLGTRLRAGDAYFKLGEQIHNKAMGLRRQAGQVVGRWRERLFDKTQIRTSVKNARNIFQKELKNPQMQLIDEVGNPRVLIEIGKDTTTNKLLEINEFLKQGDAFRPDTLYRVIDKLDDLYLKTRGTNEGRIVNTLRRNLKQQIYKSAPRNISEGLRSAEIKFGKIAETTDDVFDKLKFKAEGAARKEAIGTTEKSLARGLKADTPFEERQIWKKLDDMLPSTEKFMELYKDVFAAQDFQREGTGFLLRRLFLSPRMAAAGIRATQPITGTAGKVVKAAGTAAKVAAPPLLLKKATRNDTSKNTGTQKYPTKEKYGYTYEQREDGKWYKVK